MPNAEAGEAILAPSMDKLRRELVGIMEATEGDMEGRDAQLRSQVNMLAFVLHQITKHIR